jgi:hypothetical protein
MWIYKGDQIMEDEIGMLCRINEMSTKFNQTIKRQENSWEMQAKME